MVAAESNITSPVKQKVEARGSSESESRACTEGKMVNVGDPLCSSRKKYQPTSVTARELGRHRGSQMGS